MGMATNTTPGSVILGGDLTGSANAPELRVTGVIPNVYKLSNVVVDGKGRIALATTATSDQVMACLPIATETVIGKVQICDQLKMVESPGQPSGQHARDQLDLDMRDATTALPGKIQVGSGLEVDNGTVKLPYATTTSKGIMQAGAGLDVNNGVLSVGNIQVGEKGMVSVSSGGGIAVNAGVISYVWGDATASSRGLVQVGSGLNVSSGTLSLNVAGMPDATTSSKGLVRIGTNIRDVSGVISLNTASETERGVIQVGDGIGVSDGALSVADATYTSKGLAQAGAGIRVAGGVISIQDATTSVKGVVRVDTDFDTSNIDVSFGTIVVAYGTTGIRGVLQVGNNIDVSNGTISVATGSTSVKGVLQVGNNIDVSNGTISIPDASPSARGVAAVGDGLAIDGGTHVYTGPTVLRTNRNSTVTVAQTKGYGLYPAGSVINGYNGNIVIIQSSLTNWTFPNMINIIPGAFYHFIIQSDKTITYGSQFKFKPGSQTQPIGYTSVLSCYAVDSNTLYCIMQPNFV